MWTVTNWTPPKFSERDLFPHFMPRDAEAQSSTHHRVLYLCAPLHSLASSLDSTGRRQENSSQVGSASGQVQNQRGRDAMHWAQTGVPQESQGLLLPPGRETVANSCQGQNSTYGNTHTKKNLHRAINTPCSLPWNILETQHFRRNKSCFYFPCWITWEQFENIIIWNLTLLWDSMGDISFPARVSLQTSSTHDK